LAAVPLADEIAWIVRRNLTAALLRPAELKWTRQPDWSDEDMADAQLRADSLKRYGW
jgi:hypothetical protein